MEKEGRVSMMDELGQKLVWKQMAPYMVINNLFLDLVFTSVCNCACPWCIARTKEYAVENRAAWRSSLKEAFEIFDIRSVIILGGEATVDPDFFGKVAEVEAAMEGKHVDRLILTTNGIKLMEPDFVDKFLQTGIHSVNLSRMHWDQEVNDRIFGRTTPNREQIAALYQRLRQAGKTMRLNVNVWRGNLDTVAELERFVEAFAGCCDAIKFTPLMRTYMFDTVPGVTACTSKLAMSEKAIADLWDAFAARHDRVGHARNVMGFVDYAGLDIGGQKVLLKYAQVEDKYDRDTIIPTLKLYPNGCLSNEWSFKKDVREKLMCWRG